MRLLSSILSWCLGTRASGEVESVSGVYEPQGGAEVVYNITVENNNNFFVFNNLNHNCLIDDPHSDTDAPNAAYDPEIFNRVYDFYTSGPRQRLQPGGKIAIIQTRWGQRDLIGRVLDDQKSRGGDKWKVIEFPAIREDGKSYWPEYWPIEELEATRAAIIAGGSLWKWNAQYQQNPTGEEGAIIKSGWWKIWGQDNPDKPKNPNIIQKLPKCEYIIQSWDTASRTTQRSNYSVCTTWGIFHPDWSDLPQIILIDCWRDKLEFPDLKAKALELYKEWEPDSCIIEQKSAGEALVQEFRRMGLYVEDFTPTRGDGDKVARINSISDVFSSGVVWIADEQWTSTVLDECQAFPMGANDDIVDTVGLALHRFRRGHFIRLESDDADTEETNPFERADYY